MKCLISVLTWLGCVAALPRLATSRQDDPAATSLPQQLPPLPFPLPPFLGAQAGGDTAGFPFSFSQPPPLPFFPPFLGGSGDSGSAPQLPPFLSSGDGSTAPQLPPWLAGIKDSITTSIVASKDASSRSDLATTAEEEKALEEYLKLCYSSGYTSPYYSTSSYSGYNYYPYSSYSTGYNYPTSTYSYNPYGSYNPYNTYNTAYNPYAYAYPYTGTYGTIGTTGITTGTGTAIRVD